MFLVGELGATINADRSPFDRTLNGVFRDGARQMQRLGTRLTAALTLPLAGAGALAVKTAADYERLQTSMAVLNGSVEEGTRQFERLQEFSARTPFQLQDLAQAQNMLQGFGLSADEAFESLSMIGDIAAVSGGSIEGIGIAFGQAAAEGRLMTRDIRQLINQGVPAIKLLADSMGVASDEIFDLAEAGEISFQDLQKAFQDATTEGGMFANGMQKQSQTISGLFSTLRDNVSIALGEIGESIVETFDIKGIITDLTSSIQEGITWFNSLSEETRRMAFYVAGLLGASGPIIAALGTLGLALSGITAPIAAAVAAVAGGAALLISNWEEVETYFTTGGGAQMWDSLVNLVDSTVDAVMRIWDTFGESIMQMTESTFTVIAEVLRASFNGISLMIDTFTGRWLTDWDGYLNDSKDSLNAIYGADGSARLILEEFLVWAQTNWLVRAGHTIGAGLGNAIISGLNALNLTDEDIPLIADLDTRIAKGVSLAQSERALRRAKEQMLEDLRVDDQIIEADFDLSLPSSDAGAQIIGMFEGASNPIKQADEATQDLANSVSALSQFGIINPAMFDALANGANRTKEGLENMRAAVNPATEGLSLLQIGAMNVGNELTRTQKIGMVFGETLGNIFSQAALHGRDLLGVITNIAKQLASRAIITGLGAILTGGASLGDKSFLGALFGGFRANGGDVFAGQAYRVGEMNQPEMFIPSTNGSVQPISQGGGTKKVNLQISGQFTQNGSDLRAVINESQFIDL